MSDSLDDHLNGEMQRQDVLALKKILRDREMDFIKIQEAQQAAEDELEDAYKEIDALKQHLNDVEIQAEEAIFDLNEIESAKTRLTSKLYDLQEEMDLNEISVFKDDRLHISDKPVEINLDGESTRKKFFVGLFLGILITLIGFEIIFLINGEDEIITRLAHVFNIDFSEFSLPSWQVEEPSIQDR